jgi:Icc-related predicted phosphoesterase
LTNDGDRFESRWGPQAHGILDGPSDLGGVSVRIHVVSDVHGATVPLARAGEGADALVCLGDLILFLDYEDPSRGIFAELFGVDHARAYIEARTANRFDDAHELSMAAWARLGLGSGEERRQLMRSMVRVQYEEIFAAMPTPAFLTYGNVDIPELWGEVLRAGHTVLDGGSIDVGGMRWGFVGGGLVSPMRTPHEVTVAEYAVKVSRLGPVDVLFSHIPPAIPELCYDVLARRFEIGSQALLDYLVEVQPRYHLFGHVHQPLVARTRIGHTEAINVGHFNGSRRPFVLDL